MTEIKTIKSKNFFSFLRLAGIILLFPLSIFAQDEGDIIRVETELVPFEVTVTDKNGKPVRGLEAKDFRIFEDGVERPVDFFEPVKKNDESRPLSVVFALDVSGSMTTAELSRLRDALRSFTARLADYNSYFAVMTFGMEVKTLQSFTNRPDKLEKTFEKLLRDPEGLSTHAYDAVDEAVRLIEKKSPAGAKNKPPKRAVVLITDGFPVGDTVAPKTVIERANDAETTIYSVILPSFSRLQADKKPLPTPLEASGLIEKTGGRAFYANEKDFEPLFKSLAEEITASYVLAFYPQTENNRTGKFRRIHIEAPRGLQIKQNRSGYKPKD
ncbi:MAG TPA: VWA domain-containing protein [Pyrinomonadaceae bacterium]|nr:VWA domain-containing protein [Pyrinomonadaceae bacterium]